jgi:betaine-aldehyde dehydrogenase
MTYQSADDRRQATRAAGQSVLETFLAGDASGAAPRGWIDAHDPSTSDALWQIPDYSTAQVDAAVARAAAAGPAWKALPPAEKGARLHACADAIAGIAEPLAELISLETGKALVTESRAEAQLANAIFRYFAGLCHEMKGRSIQAGQKLFGFTTRHPWGVVAGVVPWNMPLMFMAYKVAAPLAAGNTVVIKLPEQASVSIIYTFQTIRDLLPEGVVELVCGEGATAGQDLVVHPQVGKVSFTGSVASGRDVYQSAAGLIRPVTLELGGKAPMVILPDCSIDAAIDGIFNSMRFTRGGQSCTSASRIYVHASQMDAYRERLAARLDAMVMGDALDEATECGPVVSAKQQGRINAYLDRACEDGLEIAAFGRFGEGAAEDKGYFVRPHLIFNPPHEHPVSQEEIFGPVATVSGYTDVDQVVELSNTTPFGLSASVWGRDIGQCLDIAERFRAGIVQINQNAIMLPGFSYGGVGVSGIGKESSLEAMLETYTYEKMNIVNYGTPV